MFLTINLFVLYWWEAKLSEDYHARIMIDFITQRWVALKFQLLSKLDDQVVIDQKFFFFKKNISTLIIFEFFYLFHKIRLAGHSLTDKGQSIDRINVY
jgi:hypothetical protein